MSTSGSRMDAGPPAIGDLELMRYLDGELDEPERSALEAQLAADEPGGDPPAAERLAGLEQVGDFLREMVGADDRGDSVLEAVMARIDQEAPAAAEGASETAAEVIELPQAPGRDVTIELGGGDPQPANDNSRLIYAMFGVAAAVAVGLFIWGSSGPAEAPFAGTDQTAAPSVVASSQVASAEAVAQEARARAGSQAASAEQEEPVVEIAAVDFGAQSGSVFYVSAGKNAAGSTAVVWVTDSGD